MSRGTRNRVVAEMEGVALGDPRRDRRALSVAKRLAMTPDASLPEVMADQSALEGLYRHLSSSEISLEQVLRPHVQKTVERVRKAGTAYAVSDTSGFTFGGKSRREGLGHVDSAIDQGFRAHVTLAIATDGSRQPLGVLAVGTRSRLGEDDKDHNESDRWSTGINVAESHFEPGRLIHVADRESDIFRLIAEVSGRGWRFIFRAQYDRCLETKHPEEASRLFAAVAKRQARCKLDVPISARKKQSTPKQRSAFPAREKRLATLCFTAMAVHLKRPRLAPVSLPPVVEVNVVRVWEPDPPPGVAPIEWLLYTSEPISTPTQIRRVVEGYRTRWVIEEFFKALKTGCAFEERQLESAHALFNLFAYCLLIAYAMLLMRSLARSRTDLPADELLTDSQLLALGLLSHRRLPRRPPLHQALLLIAALGGHLKNNGEPGWRTLSKGWRKLLLAEELVLQLGPARRSDQS